MTWFRRVWAGLGAGSCLALACCAAFAQNARLSFSEKPPAEPCHLPALDFSPLTPREPGRPSMADGSVQPASFIAKNKESPADGKKEAKPAEPDQPVTRLPDTLEECE